MSLRLFLTEYPESLLRDETSVVLLVLLERGGMLTEDELSEALTIGRPDLIRRLLALHRDKCIEYERQHIKVSDRGKQLVDRFALSEDIVEHLMQQLPLTDPVRNDFRDVVLRFRHESFERYLSSVTALRSWSRTCGLKVLKESEVDNYGVGCVAILMYDFADWAMDRQGKTSEEVRLPANIHRLVSDGTNISDRNDTTLSKAFEWVKTIWEVEQSDRPWAAIESSDTAGMGIYCALQMSRKILDETHWPTEWSVRGDWYLGLSRCMTTEEALHNAHRYADLHWTSADSYRELVEQKRDTLINTAIGANLGDLLLKIIAAQTIDELIQSTNLSRTSIEQILEQMKEKCISLLGEAQTD